MPQISLTQFTDIVFASPSKKAQTVWRIKNKDQSYAYYKPLTKSIENYHYGSGKLIDIATCHTKGKSEHQKRHLRACSEAYLSWLTNTSPTPVPRPSIRSIKLGDLTIRVRFELALVVGKRNRYIKLYWKEKQPPEDFHLLISALMSLAYPSDHNKGIKMQLLQLRPETKLFSTPRKLDHYSEVLKHEANSILDWWNSID